VLVTVGLISSCGLLVLELFGLSYFRFRTKSRVIAVLKYSIKGAQLVACLVIYVSHGYFYVIPSIRSILHCFFTYLSVISRIHKLKLKLRDLVIFIINIMY
jgi:hypothetical protein